MTIFSAYERDRADGVTCLPEKFNWSAALLPVLWAPVHGLWAEFALIVLGVIGLFVLDMFLRVPFLGLYLVFAVWLGFEANQLHGRALIRRGWRFVGAVHAADRVGAETAAARETPAS